MLPSQESDTASGGGDGIVRQSTVTGRGGLDIKGAKLVVTKQIKIKKLNIQAVYPTVTELELCMEKPLTRSVPTTFAVLVPAIGELDCQITHIID